MPFYVEKLVLTPAVLDMWSQLISLAAAGFRIHRGLMSRDNSGSTLSSVEHGEQEILDFKIQLIYHQLRARRALSIFKDVPLRTRRALLLYKVYGDSTLLVPNGTSLNSNSTLLVLSGTSLNSDSALLALN